MIRTSVHLLLLFLASGCGAPSGRGANGTGVAVVPSWASAMHGSERDPATGLATRVQDKETGIVLTLIPAGRFRRGPVQGLDRPDDDIPVQTVQISAPFYLGVYEVTQRQWQSVMGTNPSWFKRGLDYPVESVTYRQVLKFLARTGFRLPTQAEWEYAARAGSSEDLYGDVREIAWTETDLFNRLPTLTRPPDDKRARWWDGSFPCGKKVPNSFGLYDMIGNVEEYTADYARIWVADPPYVVDPSDSEPGESENGNIVVCGASFSHRGDEIVVWGRHGVPLDSKHDYRGFRVARDP